MQNIITDLLIGMRRFDIINEFIKSVRKMGYKPGIITLNPVILDESLRNSKENIELSDLIVCFNINREGFNVFPSLDSVERLVKSRPLYRLMAMSIFASGAANIPSSITYVKALNLDYVVFGSSQIENVGSNLNGLRN